jgi:peptide/nickel transport system permease protein
MIGYIARRFLHAVIVLFIVSLIVFGLLHALPGGLARAQLGLGAKTYQVRQLEVQEGLLKPLPVQYLIWASRALSGNLGFSYKLNSPVSALLARYLPRTILLVGTASVLALGTAVPLGLYQGLRRSKIDDHLISVWMLIFYAMPDFLLGSIGIILLNIYIPLFPSTATTFGDGSGLRTDALDLVLPVGTLFLGSVAYFSRYMRSSVIDNLLEDYVRTAYAKGQSTRGVLARHVLRNSMLSVMTLIGLSLPYVFSGALIVETLFNFPGIGLLFYDASQDRDYPVLLGVVLVVTVTVVVGSLLADLGYALLDPRVRLFEEDA